MSRSHAVGQLLSEIKELEVEREKWIAYRPGNAKSQLAKILKLQEIEAAIEAREDAVSIYKYNIVSEEYLRY